MQFFPSLCEAGIGTLRQTDAGMVAANEYLSLQTLVDCLLQVHWSTDKNCANKACCGWNYSVMDCQFFLNNFTMSLLHDAS